jgi:hypothetical protein
VTQQLSARNRRILALGVRGGDGDDPTDRQVLLDRAGSVTDLSDDDVAALRADIEDAITSLFADPTSATDDDVAMGELLAEARTAVLAEQDKRTEAQAEREAKIEGLLAQVRPVEDDEGEPVAEADAGPEDDETDDAADPAADDAPGDAEEDQGGDGAPDATVEVEEEKIAAAAVRPARVTRVEARGARRTRPVTKPSGELTLRASANALNVQAGQILRTNDDLLMVLDQAIRASQNYQGPRQYVPLFSAGSWNAEEIYGPERTLGMDPIANADKIAAVCSPQALRASGGRCSPLEPQYEVDFYGTDARPVTNEMLVRFGANRGGIRAFPPVTLADVDGTGATDSAISEWTEDNDQNPSSPTTKPYLTLTCPQERTAEVNAYPQFLKVGNFRQQFWPEQVRAWVNMAAVWVARYMERKWLTAIGAGSTALTDANQTLGTARDVLATLDLLLAGMRSRSRLPRSQPIRVGLPDWLRDNIRVDLMREQPGSTAERMATSEAEIASFFAVRNANITWFIDGESGQEFGAQGAGAVHGWPSTVVGYVYPEGSWLHLDGGQIDFGIMRDSTLSLTNDFMIGSETFEGIFYNGLESFRLEIDICPSGKTSLPVSIDPCPAGS